MEKLIDQLKTYNEAPPKKSWKELEQRLEYKRHKGVISIYKKLSIAAIFIALVACVGVMSIYIKSHNPDRFTVSTVYEPVLMEPLESSQDDIYDLKKIRTLHKKIESHSKRPSRVRNF